MSPTASGFPPGTILDLSDELQASPLAVSTRGDDWVPGWDDLPESVRERIKTMCLFFGLGGILFGALIVSLIVLSVLG